MNNKKALVLGGGGHFGIAWELGYIRGLFDEGIDLRGLDVIVGTSAGSQVGALLVSNKTWDTLWAEQIEREIHEVTPISDEEMEKLFVEYNDLAKASSDKLWIEGMAKISEKTRSIIPESERLLQIKERLGNEEILWKSSLRIVATSLETAERVVFDYKSDTRLLDALAASSALPGVWPAIEINEHKYFDGGSYSMENPDVILDANKILVLSTGLPINTPYKIDELLGKMKKEGKLSTLIVPNVEVMKILKKYNFNTVNAKLRSEVAEVARIQGQQDAESIRNFFEISQERQN